MLGKGASYADTLHNMGNLFYTNGRYEEALDYYQRAIKVKEAVLEKGHISFSDTMFNIGLLLESMHRYEEALDYFSSSL